VPDFDDIELGTAEVKVEAPGVPAGEIVGEVVTAVAKAAAVAAVAGAPTVADATTLTTEVNGATFIANIAITNTGPWVQGLVIGVLVGLLLTVVGAGV
jgi:hypothetical protein